MTHKSLKSDYKKTVCTHESLKNVYKKNRKCAHTKVQKVFTKIKKMCANTKV